jgi:CheY-like chemotaxis protein
VDLLRDLGFEADVASSAQEALEKLSADPRYDVIFTDVVMPGMSGIEFAKVVRKQLPGMPVVLTSGYSHVLVEEGRHGFPLLQKPYSASDVARALTEAQEADRPFGN